MMTGIDKMVLAGLALTIGLASCSRENLPGGGVTTIFASTEAQEETRTSLSGDDASGYQVLWSEGDEISAVNADEISYKLTLTEGAGSRFGKFTCSETIPDGEYRLFYGTDGSLLPRIQQYLGDGVISNAPMFTPVSMTDGSVSSATLKNLCGLLRLTLKGTDTIKTIKIASDEDMSGMIHVQDDGTISFVRNRYTDVSLDLGEGVELTPDGKSFYVSLPPADYRGVTIEIVPAEGEAITKTLKSDKTLNITRAMITPVSISLLPPAPKPDVLCGEFSVSSSKKVHFSKGNLQATKNSDSGYSWGFANEQYQYVGAKAGNTTIDSQAAGSVVDLFSWSTTSYYYGITTASPYYAYPGEYREWGTVFDNKGTWYTLSNGEWSYLLGRAGKVGSAKVCGVNGMLLLPDTFEDPMTNNGSGAFVPRSTSSAWTANVYAGSDWTAMETAGAVFLPAAGWRVQDPYSPKVTLVGKVGVLCNYWSSTPWGNSLMSSYNVTYGVDELLYDRVDRSYGNSVRLVTVVNQ